MSYFIDIKDLEYSAIKDGTAIAFFVEQEDAVAFIETHEDDLRLGQYIDIDVVVSVRGDHD